MVSTQVTFVFTRREPLAEERLDIFADACLDALNRDARFIAFGPVVSADYERSAIEVECTVCTETLDDEAINAKTEAIRKIALDGLAVADYEITEQRVPALA